MLSKLKNVFARNKIFRITPRAIQRRERCKIGKYLCQVCQTQFNYAKGELRCPKCRTDVADNLIPFYTEEDPRSEMLGLEEFQAGD